MHRMNRTSDPSVTPKNVTSYAKGHRAALSPYHHYHLPLYLPMIF